MDWLLLKRVSRSFDLTLRLLPGPVRETIALGYLLARLSDTHADGASSEAERELLGREPEILAWLAAASDRWEIEEVWTTIREGQQFDMERFSGVDPTPLTEEELDRYIYLVAGCVGEFWTKVCAKHLPGFSRRPIPEMQVLGVRFGKGLQLVNILRDRQSDAALNRVYVPDERLAASWELARAYLDSAEEYSRALTFRRLRAACALPFLMGRETLDLVAADPARSGAKISRSRVRWLLLRALFF